jgi:hypothetical protein
LISNSYFKIHFEFEKVFNIKLVELEILKISYLEKFSSYYMILGVIWQKQFKIENLGGAAVAGESKPGTAWHGRRRVAVAFGQLLVAPVIATSPARAFEQHWRLLYQAEHPVILLLPFSLLLPSLPSSSAARRCLCRAATSHAKRSTTVTSLPRTSSVARTNCYHPGRPRSRFLSPLR